MASMSRFAAFKSGHPLHGIGEHLLALVFECAPHEQLCAWLRAPLEHAAANSNGDLVMMLLAARADAFVRSQSILDRPHLAAAAQGGNRAVVSALIASASAPTGEERLFDVLGGDDGNVTAVAGGGTDKGADVVSETRSGIGSSGSDSGSDSGSINISDSASTSSGSTSSSGNSRSGNSSNSSSKSSSGCRTPLHFAASGGHVSAVKALVQAGVDIDVVDEEGCSALHLAVFRGFDKVVEELVSAGANVDTSDSEGETPLHTACGHGNLEMVRALLRDSRRQALSARGNRGVHLEMSPLHRASLGGHCQIMEELLDHGSNLDSLTGNARTPLHAAAMSGSADAVRFLLERNPCSLEAKDQEGRTALHLAAGHRLGSDGTLTALLAAGADMESKTALGETSLLKACKALRVSAVRILLRWGADEAAIDVDGRSPAVMVSQLLQTQHPGVFRDDLQTILRVLAGAPADRVWRRRGWLVMVRSSSRRKGFHRTEGGGSDCGRAWSRREGFCRIEGGSGDYGRSMSRLEGFHSIGGGGGDCGRSSPRREGFGSTEGGGDCGGDCGRSSSRRAGGTPGYKWAWCPPRKLAGVVIDRADVERNCDSRPARNKIDRQGAGGVLHPRVNYAARENNSARCRLKTRRTVLEPEHALERSCGEARVGREEDGDGGFRSMVERAIGVEEDGVFRNIVAFL